MLKYIWCERMLIYGDLKNERQIRLLIDFGYQKTYIRGTFY